MNILKKIKEWLLRPYPTDDSTKSKILDDPAHLVEVDVVVLLDPTLVGNELDYEAVLQYLKPDGALLINTSKKAATEFNKKFKGSLFHLNASQIAQETIGRNIPNVAMVGGLTKILNLEKKAVYESLIRDLNTVFSQKIVEKNLQAFDQGFEKIIPIES